MRCGGKWKRAFTLKSSKRERTILILHTHKEKKKKKGEIYKFNKWVLEDLVKPICLFNNKYERDALIYLFTWNRRRNTKWASNLLFFFFFFFNFKGHKPIIFHESQNKHVIHTKDKSKNNCKLKTQRKQYQKWKKDKKNRDTLDKFNNKYWPWQHVW